MIRELEPYDLPAVETIENAAQVFPWKTAAFQRCLEAGYPGWVLEADAHLIAFIFISMSPISHECHILNLCVHPDSQRLGLGEEMLEFAITWAKAEGAMIVYLEVRRSNKAAIQLYRKLNFKLIGERKNYYPTAKGQEDAMVFARDLGIETLLSAEWGVE